VLSQWLPGLGHLQNIHPLVVHFPIAMLYGATLLYFLAWLNSRESLMWTALWVLVLGLLGAAVSLATGLFAGPGVMIAESVRDQLLYYHMRIMIAVSVLSAILTVWALIARPMPQRGRYLFLFGLLLAIAMLTKGADYGGRLVYDYNAGGNACSQPIDFTQ
jgi:uncharacterized membrane protein